MQKKGSKMFGAIIGDIIGSAYEFHNVKTKDFPLFTEKSCFTDDTILTCAVADWLFYGGKPEKFLKNWGFLYKDRTYENGTIPAFGKNFMKWLETGVSSDAKTNGCVMRLSPVGFWEKNLKTALDKAFYLTKITHNNRESLNATRAYIETMFLIKNNTPVNLIKNCISTKYGYDMSKSVDEVRDGYNKFYCSCKNTVPQAIICALDATSYEDAIRNAISLGGDSDTLACMAGGIAELRFDIPLKIRSQACQYIDNNILSMVRTFYQKVR